MSNQHTTEEMERPAKKWEVAAVTKAQELQSAQLQTIDTKLDRVLDLQITEKDVDAKIKVVEDKFDGKIDAVYKKYDPPLNNTRWALRAIVGAVVTLLVTTIATFLWGK